MRSTASTEGRSGDPRSTGIKRTASFLLPRYALFTAQELPLKAFRYPNPQNLPCCIAIVRSCLLRFLPSKRLVYVAINEGGPVSALDYFNDTHQMVRDTVRKFVEKEILPHVDDWEEAGEFPRELYGKAAAAGILGINAPEQYGGTGEDVFMKIAACEELVRSSSGGLCASLGSLDIGLPPVWKWGSEAMKDRVIPEVLRGEKISALAITEPDDILTAIRTEQTLSEDIDKKLTAVLDDFAKKFA